MQKKIFFAPMEGITDSIYRYYILTNFNDWDFAVTDFLRLPSEQTITTKMISHHIGEQTLNDQKLLNRTILQILFSERSNLEQATNVINSMGLKMLDLNFGCPSKKVNAHHGGAYLLQNPQLMAKMVKVIRKSFTGKLSAKIRTGYHCSDNLHQIVHMLEQEGIDYLTIHGRTRDQLYSGLADWKIMEETAELFPTLPIIGNGDIKTSSDLHKILNKNLFAGVMIGRGAIANPWIAQEFKTKKQQSKDLPRFFKQLQLLYLQANLSENNILKRFKSLAHHMISNREILRVSSLSHFFSHIESRKNE